MATVNWSDLCDEEETGIQSAKKQKYSAVTVKCRGIYRRKDFKKINKCCVALAFYYGNEPHDHLKNV